MSNNTADTLCPCCNNPWSRAVGNMLDNNNNNNKDEIAMFCGVCDDDNNDESKKKKDGNMDTSTSPTSNFYRYANGGWMDKNPIPPGYPSWNTFLHLHVTSQERLKGILEELLKEDDGNNNTNNNNEYKVGVYYKAALDEDAVEEAGLHPLMPALNLCEEIVEASVLKDGSTAVATLLGKLYSKFGIAPFFHIGVSPDNKNSQHSICQLSQGGLGLPDRDYYVDEDKKDKRDLYKQHVATMLSMLLDDEMEGSTSTTEEAELVYEFELQLANSHMTKTESRDPIATYNKYSIEELVSDESLGNNVFDFAAYLTAATGKTPSQLGDINVRNVKAVVHAVQLLQSIDENTLRQYLRWHVVDSCASYLPRAFVKEDFHFFETVLSGTTEMKPRWKRAMAFTEGALGEALGQLYCHKYFDENCKEYALSIVENVRKALEERLKEVDWMTSDVTREQALKKMDRFKVKIGYPDKWIDYSSLTFDPTDPLLTHVFRSRAFNNAREAQEMNAPTDTDKWFMTPQTINAYYHPLLNEIVFPAAILQPPFFQYDTKDDAINYGAMGAVVGHEMTHGFDDQGRKFNFEGNMVDWWTKSDAEEYERRVDVMVTQANNYEVHGQHVKGQLTCGENIADLGGLRLALRALNATTQKEGEETKDENGLTSTQRFFIGWAQCWRQNITKERSLQLLTLDPHGPNEMRCNGPLSNMEEFHEAFGVAVEDPMWKPKDERVDIW